jgi:hypothetical protein
LRLLGGICDVKSLFGSCNLDRPIRAPYDEGTARASTAEALMAEAPTLLKALLTERHLQTHAAFSREYTKIARRIDPALASTAPGREQYQRWLSGRVKTRPHPDHCRVLERMFPGHTVGDLFGRHTPSTLPLRHIREHSRHGPEPLSITRAPVAGALLEQLWVEPARMFEALDTTMVSDARLREFQMAAVRLGVQVVRVPPGTLIEEALANFRDIRELLTQVQSLTVHRELVRCGAMFATIVGEILFNEGRFPLARRWYGVARRAAEEAQDQYLADIALAGSTYIPTYAPDPRGVLDQVDPRLGSARNPSPAIAWLWGFKAKAHATLGDSQAFQHAIAASRRTLDTSPPHLLQPGIFSFLPEKLAFYEARGWVELLDAERASQAADRAVGMYDLTETTEPALVRFEQASAFAQAGELAQACRTATDAVLDRHTYHSVTVITRANEFDRLLGASNNAAVRGWRELLAGLRPPQPTLTAEPENMLDDN